MTDTVKSEANDKEISKISKGDDQNERESSKEREETNENENEEKKHEEKTAEKVDIDDPKGKKVDESALGRFLSWWRGKAKEDEVKKDQEEKKKDENETSKNEENETRKNDENERRKNDNEEEKSGEKDSNETNIKISDNDLITENGSVQKTEECNKEIEIEKDNDDVKDFKVKHQTGVEIITAKNDVVSHDDRNSVRSSGVTERRLEKILEEQKSTSKTAPLAQQEDEEFDCLESRQSIDRSTSKVKTSESQEPIVNRDLNQTEESKDKSEETFRARVETIFVFGKPTSEQEAQTTCEQSVNTLSENDELKGVSSSEKQGTQQSGKNEDYKEKMEEVIEERHHDVRKDNVQETWKRIEEASSPGKETGNKTFRVSYTIRTETIETKKNNDDDNVDDDRLFGNGVLLNSAPPKTHEGPPPEDLEPEIVEEHAREDESGADIDRFFELCKQDGAAPLAKGDEVESESGTLDERDSKPQIPEDVFTKLRNWDGEPTDWWTITKKKKEYEEWMKPMKDGTIRRVIIPNVEIPYQTCVRFITDWNYREKWDKTFSEIQILKSDKESKLIYCPVKKYDLTFETTEQEEAEPPSHILAWKKQQVIEGEKTDTLTKYKKQIQVITHTCGIILRPAASGDNATRITILCQLEGPVDGVLKNTFLSGHPKSWLRNLKKYYKKQQAGDSKKVVYL